jgi:hypothetical protein
MIRDPHVETHAFPARICLGIATIGFVIFLAGLLMAVFR